MSSSCGMDALDGKPGRLRPRGWVKVLSPPPELTHAAAGAAGQARSKGGKDQGRNPPPYVLNSSASDVRVARRYASRCSNISSGRSTLRGCVQAGRSAPLQELGGSAQRLTWSVHQPLRQTLLRTRTASSRPGGRSARGGTALWGCTHNSKLVAHRRSRRPCPSVLCAAPHPPWLEPTPTAAAQTHAWGRTCSWLFTSTPTGSGHAGLLPWGAYTTPLSGFSRWASPLPPLPSRHSTSRQATEPGPAARGRGRVVGGWHQCRAAGCHPG